MRFRHSTTRSARTALAALVLFGILGLGSCSGGEPVAAFEPVTDPAQLFSRLTLDQHAINLSMASPTFQLTATPFNAAGTVMTGLPAPIFHSGDTTAVLVDSMTGVLTARRGDVTGVEVTAEIVAPGNLRRTDTAHVNTISTEPPVLTSFSVDAGLYGDLWSIWSASSVLTQRIIGFVTGLPLELKLQSHALDATNTEIQGLVVEYASLDSAVAVVDRWSGAVTVLRPGSVRMMARTTAYDITKTDIHTFTVTLPGGTDVIIYRKLNGSVVAGTGPSVFSPSNVVASEYRIAPHGYVGWTNLMTDSVDLQFEDPTNVAAVPTEICSAIPFIPCGEAGDVLLPPASNPDCPNILLFCQLSSLQMRQFPVPGVYRYSSTRTGLTGTIVVGDEGTAD